MRQTASAPRGINQRPQADAQGGGKGVRVRGSDRSETRSLGAPDRQRRMRPIGSFRVKYADDLRVSDSVGL
jgi:hypothetical protein